MIKSYDVRSAVSDNTSINTGIYNGFGALFERASIEQFVRDGGNEVEYERMGGFTLVGCLSHSASLTVHHVCNDFTELGIQRDILVCAINVLHSLTFSRFSKQELRKVVGNQLSVSLYT